MFHLISYFYKKKIEDPCLFEKGWITLMSRESFCEVRTPVAERLLSSFIFPAALAKSSAELSWDIMSSFDDTGVAMPPFLAAFREARAAALSSLLRGAILSGHTCMYFRHSSIIQPTQSLL